MAGEYRCLLGSEHVRQSDRLPLSCNSTKVSVQAFLDLTFLHFLCQPALADASHRIAPRNPQLAQNGGPLRRSSLDRLTAGAFLLFTVQDPTQSPPACSLCPSSSTSALSTTPLRQHEHKHHRRQHRRRCRPTATQSATPALTRDAIPRTDSSARVARCVRSPVFAPTAT